MTMDFLYKNFDVLTNFGSITNKKFAVIEDNLSKMFPIRDYQTKAFSRLDFFLNQSFTEKTSKPYHLLFNMATGSGKTLVMAGLILYLYERGYRNYIFIVPSNNLIVKTKDNFLNNQSTKYLFAEKIIVDGKEVFLNEVETFDGIGGKDINIKFTTIQKLHSDLYNTKENSITFEDFENGKFVILADEAHHLNSQTKSKNGELFESWENTVLAVLFRNTENLLLEFTATLDYERKEIASKYKNKVIFKYDLSQFRIDKFSKEINLIRSLFDEEGRVLQALILNLYRQELAAKNNINLKPVILFKAKKTIAESRENKTKFHRLIDSLNIDQIEEIQRSATVPIVQKAFQYFRTNDLTNTDIVVRLKSNFKPENCISANNDEDAEKNQLLLNTLEDENNPIRAVFAVQKLNEGWDVLNLYDIVRLYETRDGKDGKVGATTMSEAQLIGRGARYFPFVLKDEQDKFRRKYDDDLSNDLKILEELYYHTKEDSRYISELKKALIETGIYEDDEKIEIKKLTLKDSFKKSDFYLYGQVCFNEKQPKNFANVKSFEDLKVFKKDYRFSLSSGFGKMTSAFFEMEAQYEGETMTDKRMPISDIPSHIIRYAISQNPFYYFDNISKLFPNLKSIAEFISSPAYLASLTIVLIGSRSRCANLTNKDLLSVLQNLLKEIENDLKTNLTVFEGSTFIKDFIRNIFKDKEIKVQKGSERANGQEDLLVDASWYVYNANYGTTEEKSFVNMFSRYFEQLNRKFEDIYLIRNERNLGITDEYGNTFEPDFLLFCKQKEKMQLTYQVFIEPKGKFLMPYDKWKEDFLLKIREGDLILNIDSEKYKITGVPFYNNEDENAFNKSLQAVLKLD